MRCNTYTIQDSPPPLHPSHITDLSPRKVPRDQIIWGYKIMYKPLQDKEGKTAQPKIVTRDMAKSLFDKVGWVRSPFCCAFQSRASPVVDPDPTHPSTASPILLFSSRRQHDDEQFKDGLSSKVQETFSFSFDDSTEMAAAPAAPAAGAGGAAGAGEKKKGKKAKKKAGAEGEGAAAAAAAEGSTQ